jgi:hypothetical protein
MAQTHSWMPNELATETVVSQNSVRLHFHGSPLPWMGADYLRDTPDLKIRIPIFAGPTAVGQNRLTVLHNAGIVPLPDAGR